MSTTRTYYAWSVYGRTKSAGAFPLWKRLSDFVPVFVTKAAAKAFLKQKRIRLGGFMGLHLVRVRVVISPHHEIRKAK